MKTYIEQRAAIREPNAEVDDICAWVRKQSESWPEDQRDAFRDGAYKTLERIHRQLFLEKAVAA